MDLTTLITGSNLLLLGGVVGIGFTVRGVFPEFWATKLGKRLLPILPIILGVIGSNILGVAEGVSSVQERFLLGIIVGFMAGHSYKLGRTTLAGADSKSDQPIQEPQQLNEEK